MRMAGVSPLCSFHPARHYDYYLLMLIHSMNTLCCVCRLSFQYPRSVFGARRNRNVKWRGAKMRRGGSLKTWKREGCANHDT